jgi:glycosyltransferase involved in cell wall biosynthesis
MGYASLQEITNFIESAIRLYSTTAYDYTLISREILNGYPSFEDLVPKNLIYDIDDAIFLSSPATKNKTRKLVERAKVVFAGNQYLGNWCKSYSKNVHILPTAVDTDRFYPVLTKKTNTFVVGWSGTSAGIKYISEVESQLLHFFETHENAVLSVCSDRYPSELVKLAKYIRFEHWSAENEVRQIQSFNVGIMPMSHEDWALGKCSYKMLLYLSCAVPCCVTNWGMNSEILNQGLVGLGVDRGQDWCEALDFMYKSRFELQNQFPDCRLVVKKYYSVPVIANSFAKALDL